MIILRSTPVIFSCKNLYKTIDNRKVIDNISLTVHEGEIVALLGSNGSGKSLCLNIAVGLDNPDSGEVWIENSCVTSLELYQRVRKGLRYIPQEPALFQNLTVEENLISCAEIFLTSPQEKKIVIEQLINDFHMESIYMTQVRFLSQGELRKLELARALIGPGRILILDEPWSGVDVLTIQTMKLFLKNRVKEKKIGILITGHHVHDTLSFVDYGYIIKSGILSSEGFSQELIELKIEQDSIDI
jgi:lipopolysaccharide export system ATP-binding protein